LKLLSVEFLAYIGLAASVFVEYLTLTYLTLLCASFVGGVIFHIAAPVLSNTTLFPLDPSKLIQSVIVCVVPAVKFTFLLGVFTTNP